MRPAVLLLDVGSLIGRPRAVSRSSRSASTGCPHSARAIGWQGPKQLALEAAMADHLKTSTVAGQPAITGPVTQP